MAYDWTEIPYVGPRTAQDMHDMGFTELAEAASADPEDMYNRLCEFHGLNIDRCQLYVFRMIVYYAKGGRNSNLLKWWKWKD